MLLQRGCWNVELRAVLSVQVRAMLMQQQKFVRRLDDEGLVPASSNQASGEDVALRTNGKGTAANDPPLEYLVLLLKVGLAVWPHIAFAQFCCNPAITGYADMRCPSSSQGYYYMQGWLTARP